MFLNYSSFVCFSHEVNVTYSELKFDWNIVKFCNVGAIVECLFHNDAQYVFLVNKDLVVWGYQLLYIHHDVGI
jgi:hypothetical protein